MKQIKLPGTDLSVSALCLGASQFGARVESAEAFALLDAFRGAGGNFIDTANVYGKWLPAGRAESELLLGAWMAERGNRDAVVIGTKGAHPAFSDWAPRLSPECIAADLEESLRNLRTDRIDLYYLHRDDPGTPVGPVIDALEAHAAAGKIRYYACSNWSAARIAEAQAYAAGSGARGFVANQPLWNLAAPNDAALAYPGMLAMDPAMYALHRETGLAAIPYSAQAGGLFTKMLREDFDDARFDGIRKSYVNPQTQERAERVGALCEDTGLEPTQIALLYLLKQPFTTVPVVGCKNLAHLKSTLAAEAVMGVDLEGLEDFQPRLAPGQRPL